MSKNIKFDVIVTRHPALVDFVQERGLAASDVPVISHADAEDVTGKNVCGVLPHSLSCRTKTMTEIPLDLPEELRGKELDIEQVRKYALPAVTYAITKLFVTIPK